MEAPGRAQPLADDAPPPTDPRPPRLPHDPTKRAPRNALQDARLARSATLAGREAAAGQRRVARLPSGASKPLVPVTERRSHEEGVRVWRIKNDSEGDNKTDITPDGGSAGREGRKFTVSNVGNNGRIYLRPTIRPAHERPPQPHFVFPITPPNTAGLDNLVAEKTQNEAPSARAADPWPPTPVPHASAHTRQMSNAGPASRPRALSDSTIRGAPSSAVKELDDGAFRVVISKPADETRPKTMEDIEPDWVPVLDINIPTWKIGSPRFTGRGSPMIRGSSYAPTDEFRSSHASFLNRSYPEPSLTVPSRFSSRRPSRRSAPSMQVSFSQPTASPMSIPTPQVTFPLRSTYLSTHLVIEPAMFDDLTFKPACDDRAIVRYAVTGTVTAATPPRLVSEITSPSFLDYELISDFFLTFRAFLEPSDLVRMLFSRLRWAIERGDQIGMVVRVRTFVALRHWVLNYFMDDFFMDYALRVSFCNLLNDLMEDLYRDEQNGKAHLKILSELKKCWRRVCALCWDGAEFDTSLGGEVPITPGGSADELRDPELESSEWEDTNTGTSHSENNDQALTTAANLGPPGNTFVANRPGTPDNDNEAAEELKRLQQTSPTSLRSIDVVSCSFPAMNLRNLQSGLNTTHPVPANAAHIHSGMVAMTPKALMGKRVRPMHKRNGSITDSLRDHSIDRTVYKDVGDPALALPYAGSLVRGDLLPPGQPFVDVVQPLNIGDMQRESTFLHSAKDRGQMRRTPSAMSGQGMKRLIGGVRRALSTKGQGISATQGNFINISPDGPRGATTNRLPGTAIVPQARSQLDGIRPPVRIDLLGAGVAEDFKKAVREAAAAEAAAEEAAVQKAQVQRDSATQPASSEEEIKYSAAHLDSSFEDLPKPPGLRPTSDAAFTSGSKSIMIIDDTAFDMPAMTGALPAMNPSLEAFADIFTTNGLGPTPPITPPGRPIGTPRRSSYLLNHHMARASMSSDPLPPFIPDMETLGAGSRTSSHHQFHVALPSMDQSISDVKPFTSSPRLRSTRFHNRQRSSRTNISMSSVLHRRAVSFNSSTRPPTLRSFDATTVSGESVMDASEAAPAPLRVLRRRPGGNLGAAKTVGELKAPLRPSRSVGSLTAYSESLRSSYMQQRDSSGFVDIISTDFSQAHADTFSLGAMAEKPRRHMSLFSTHSSKPIMRPSFEAEARKLAQLPDDADDDGGVEAALLKLEGKYEKKSAKSSPEPQGSPLPDLDAIGVATCEPGSPDNDELRGFVSVTDADDEFTHHQYSGVPEPSSDVHGSYVPGPATESRSIFSTEPSYCSIPLLERGLSDDYIQKPSTQEWTNISILQGPDEDTPAMTERGGDSQESSRRPSFDLVEETESVHEVRGEDIIRPGDESERQSFLDDDSDEEGGSDLSSELSAESPDSDYYGLGMPSQVSPRQGFVLKPPSQDRGNAPPSPPVTLGQALHMSSEASNVPQLHEHQVFVQKPLPPTPDVTPTTTYRPELPRGPAGTSEALRSALCLEASRKHSAHLPFILAFDSEILAQQFTLIEKDALNEIDWRELIDMEWKSATNKDSRSWVDFLRGSDARGVEVVIARFNIMVKWAVSEIVLTQDVEERARCVIKFLHIATHARRYRNFATMAQIVVALSSQEVARLSRTWALVPARDLSTFSALEQLVSPTRNFHALRAEMEGGAGSGIGCIPFVGIYTHDLLFAAQRPSEIASSPTTAPLVNFERCRCAAAVVKTLLRLLEESGSYGFQPVEGITERCLWMGALGDDEIRRRSEALE